MSQSAFSTTPTILAVPPSALANIAAVRETYGSTLPVRPADADSPEVLTLAGHRDRLDSDDLRPAILGETCIGHPLTDARLAFTAHFTTAFLTALATDPLLAEVATLTEAELSTLTPVPDPDIEP